MVLMHLGLTDGPFVPHNLISTQNSPVPLLKFHMVPRWNPSQIDAPPLRPSSSFIHLSKSPVYEPPPHTRFTSDGKGPSWREMPVSGNFLNISPGSPAKEFPLSPPPQSLFKERCSIPRAPFLL